MQRSHNLAAAAAHQQTLVLGLVSCAVLFGDIGKKAAGQRGRSLVYAIIYSLDATRCVILHLAATQSLQHALGDSAPPMWQCGLAVLIMAAAATQVRAHMLQEAHVPRDTASDLASLLHLLVSTCVPPSYTCCKRR